ncbi:FG-GAP-like repeat-containing protein [Tunicatimonas pelagia]|uniref:FG-GAP-like repeat-containing protein n=1 Tax=Tunicatimonas pelagia TaxID=931531 RepID=UPI0026651AE6|nr:FG-GAP-like repeat-containing protein [Tunicatimonas pelagia]WKN43305.1 FG-GAP-like repeat-containing protein [Tunicatimonas pelagia]
MILILYLLATENKLGQSFQEVEITGGVGLWNADVQWGDMNGDGQLDLIHIGSLGGDPSFFIFYQDQGSFIPTSQLPIRTQAGVTHQSFDLGDFDRDGDIDIILSEGAHSKKLLILENTREGFREYTNQGFVINSVPSAAVMWGDYDRDGDSDFFFSKFKQLNIYQNRKGIFARSTDNSIRDLTYGNWVDLDGDQDLDLIGSVSEDNVARGYVWKNDGFGDFQRDILGYEAEIHDAQAADYDGDGKIDLLLKSYVQHSLQRLVSGNTETVSIDFPETNRALWGDFNNDGWYDILLNGHQYCANEAQQSYLYINQEGKDFTQAVLPEIKSLGRSVVATADYDKDGDLDVVMTGYKQFHLYRNLWIEQGKANTIPLPPAGLSEQVVDNQVSLSWSKDVDLETNVASLTYNVYVKDEQGSYVISPLSDTLSGFRRVARPGNASLNSGFTLRCLPAGTYAWAVQSVDANYRGSVFTAERKFTIQDNRPVAPKNAQSTTISNHSIRLEWKDESDSEAAYEIYRVSEDEEFTPIDRPLATLPKNVTSFLDTFNLTSNTSYTYKIVSANCTYPDKFFAQLEAATFPDPYEADFGLYLDETEGTFSSLADLDNDGDLDLLLSSANEETNATLATHVYLWQDTYYERTNQKFPPVFNDATLRWIDFNNDGYLDFWLNLRERWYVADSAGLFINDGTGHFTAQLPSEYLGDSIVLSSNFVWEDYDHDGDVDIMQSKGGYNEAHPITIYEQKDNREFLDSNITSIRGDIKSSQPWADYDNDGDLDIIVAQTTSCGVNRWVIYEQKASKVFEPNVLEGLPAVTAHLPLSRGKMTWLDYDGDGWLDILLAGSTYCGNGEGKVALLRNMGDRSFTEVFQDTFVREIYDIQIAWGDYDNDGDTDILIYGDPHGGAQHTHIYENQENLAFRETYPYLLKHTHQGHMSVGDIEGDGDLDVVVLGETDYVSPKVILYRNNMSPRWNRVNSPPESPTNLQASVSGSTVIFSWDASTDAESSSTHLTYNLFVKDANGRFVVHPYANENGVLQYPTLGNAQKNNFFVLTSLPEGIYEWGVQAIDNGHLGSAFSLAQTLMVDALTPTAIIEEQPHQPVLFYPNPVTQSPLYLKLPPGEIGTYDITIVDSFGKLCYSQQLAITTLYDPLEINWLANQSGVYMATVRHNDKVYHQKLIFLNLL